jgi:chromosome segregation ATPase
MSDTVSEAGSAGAVKGRSPEEIEHDVARVAGELQRLRAAQEALAGERSAAVEERDAWRLEEIDGRARTLSEEADAAQARLCRLHAERARAELPEAEEKAGAARAEYERAHAEYLRAYELTNRLGVEADNASMRAARLRQGVADNVRQALELERNLPPRLRGADVRQS